MQDIFTIQYTLKLLQQFILSTNFRMKRKFVINILFALIDDDENELREIIKLLPVKKRRKETNELLRCRGREGTYAILIDKYLLTDDDKFVKFLRVTPNLFYDILENIRNEITTIPCNRNPNPICPEQKLCLVLRYLNLFGYFTTFLSLVILLSLSRYLATGETQSSLSFSFRISQTWIGKILKEVLHAISTNLMFALPHPTREAFLKNEQDFFTKWNFPNVVGCLDGKHVRLRCPDKTGSLYFNYKDYFSMVLFALVDANYKFIAIDVGSYGREGDAGTQL